MSMFTRFIPVAALAICLSATPLEAQQPGTSNFRWYLGGQGGVLLFKTPNQTRDGIPMAGGHMLIVAKRTGLMLSVEEAIGENEVSSYTDANGVQPVTFNDIRKYSAVLMAFPFRSPVAPYFGAGLGIIHVVNPTPVNANAFKSDAQDIGSAGFATFLGGLQFQVGPLMAFGQYQITSSPGTQRTLAPNGVVAEGEMLVGPTHTFSGGLRFSLGGARERYH